MYKVILIVGLLILLYYFLQKAIHGRIESPGGRDGLQGSGSGNNMVQDPFCRVFVPRGSAFCDEVGGQTYFFCSQACAKAFQKQLSS